MSDTSKFSHDKKKKLADRISKIKKKSDLEKIFEIVYEENKQVTENNNGIFMYFHNLSNETYMKLEAFLDKNSKKKDNKMSEEHDTLSEKEFVSYVQEDGFNNDQKMKLSNKEKIIVKRILYDDTLAKSNNLDDDILIDSDPKN